MNSKELARKSEIERTDFTMQFSRSFIKLVNKLTFTLLAVLVQGC